MTSHDAVWEHRWVDQESGVRSVVYHALYCLSDLKHINIPELLSLLSEVSI